MTTSGTLGIGPPRGVHFTFIPFVGSLACSAVVPASEKPRQLPEVHALWADDVGDNRAGEHAVTPQLSMLHQPSMSPPAASSSNARVLKPPMELPTFEDQGEGGDGVDKPAADLDVLQCEVAVVGQQALKTRILAPRHEGAGDPDDWFSRTGL